MNRITGTALAIMAMGACAGMRISQEPRVAKLPPTGMLVTDDSTVGTKSVPVGAIAALVSDSGFARVSGHVDSARASKVADSAKKLPTAGTAGTYRSVTTDAFGRVVAGTAPTTLGPGYGVAFRDTVLANHYVRNDTTQAMAGPLTVPGGVYSSVFQGANTSSTFGNTSYATVIIGTTVIVYPRILLAGGIQGRVDGSRAASGIVGEVIDSKTPNLFALSIASNTPTNVTSISLTAGNWEVSGGIIMPGSGITSPTSANYTGSISPTSGTHLADGTQVTNTEPTKTTTDSYVSISLPPRTISLTATTTYYLVASRVFSAGTCWAGGYLHARRVW